MIIKEYRIKSHSDILDKYGSQHIHSPNSLFEVASAEDKLILLHHYLDEWIKRMEKEPVAVEIQMVSFKHTIFDIYKEFVMEHEI